ncbi:MAG TPA: hypothetical protein VL992_05000, partial [Tepidisphaeraceae bacterium]|nr:hypothetical protein [Tepidisphaeraceae bacterium]
VNQLIAEIAAASAEQSQGVSQVNQAIQQMDKVTQGNAASAEESAASAEELNSQSEQLRSVVVDLRSIVQGGPSRAARPEARGIAPAAPTPPARRREPLSSAQKKIPLEDPAENEDFSDFNVAA